MYIDPFASKNNTVDTQKQKLYKHALLSIIPDDDIVYKISQHPFTHCEKITPESVYSLEKDFIARHTSHELINICREYFGEYNPSIIVYRCSKPDGVTYFDVITIKDDDGSKHELFETLVNQYTSGGPKQVIWISNETVYSMGTLEILGLFNPIIDMMTNEFLNGDNGTVAT